MSQITVIIPSWKGRELLQRTLPFVMRQEQISYSVIVVENGIADDTASLVREVQKNYRNLELLQIQVNCGYAGAVNAGVAAAKTKLVAVLCNDNEPEPSWLAELSKAYGSGCSAEGAKPIAAIMSQTAMPGLDTSKRGTLNFLARNISFVDESIMKSSVPIFYPGGNAFLLDKTTLPEVFDPSYFTYHEDVYLGWRLRNLGYEILYCHASLVKSFDGGTTKRTPERTSFLTERNRWLNFLFFCEARTLFCLLPFWLLDQLASLLLGKNKFAKLRALSWLLVNAPSWMAKRKQLQKERRVADNISLASMSTKLFSEPCASWKRKSNQVLNSLLSPLGLGL